MLRSPVHHLGEGWLEIRAASREPKSSGAASSADLVPAQAGGGYVTPTFKDEYLIQPPGMPPKKYRPPAKPMHSLSLRLKTAEAVAEKNAPKRKASPPPPRPSSGPPSIDEVLKMEQEKKVRNHTIHVSRSDR